MNTATCVVRILNERTGKFEIVESDNLSVFSVGQTGTSLYLNGKDLHSTWLVEIRLTGKGSLKIDNIISRFDKSASTIHQTIDPRESIEPDQSIAVPAINTPTVEPEPEPEQAEIVIDHGLNSKGIQELDHYVVSLPDSVPQPITAELSQWQEPDYYIDPDIRLNFQVAVSMLKENSSKAIKTLMLGESGYGKTTICQRLANYLGFDCLRVNCATIRDTEEWFFDREVKARLVGNQVATETVFTPSEFAVKMARGNCVIILDEFNRIEPNIHNSLFPLLDDSQKTSLHHIDFRVGHNVIFVATMNVGYQFGGTFDLDNALLNRFEFVLEVNPMPFDHEVAVLESVHHIDFINAELIVKVATLLRENQFTCSTRDTLRIAHKIKHGLTIGQAFDFGLVRRIPNDETNAPMRKALKDLINGVLPDQQI